MVDWPTLEARQAAAIVRSGLGEPVEYTPQGGQPATVRAVFEPQPIELDTDTEVAVLDVRPVLYIREADLLAAPDEGDEVVVDGKRYEVQAPEQDGRGWWALHLHFVS